MAKEIELTQGKVAIVDDDMYDELSQHKWHVMQVASGYYYAARKTSGRNGTTYLHRVVAGAARGEHVDHINGDRLDDRRANLRICTPSQNLRNSGPRNPVSGYKGIYPTGKSGKWKAGITRNGEYQHLGVFPTLEEAARIYNEATLEYHGEFAYQNVISQE